MPQGLTHAVRSPSVAEEEPARDGEDLIEMANLREERTGVPGVIFISTRIGAHGPRVKWYEARPAESAPSFSVSIAEAPEVLASGVDDRLLRRHAVQVSAWVTQNREVLLAFWTEGAGLFEDERAALLARLTPLT